MALILILVAIFAFIIAYVTYGSWLAKEWGVDITRKTPAHTLTDGVHDFSSLFSSIRHEGKSIGHVIEKNIGMTGKRLFNIFVWLTLALVIAAFANIVVNTFVACSSCWNNFYPVYPFSCRLWLCDQ